VFGKASPTFRDVDLKSERQNERRDLHRTKYRLQGEFAILNENRVLKRGRRFLALWEYSELFAVLRQEPWSLMAFICQMMIHIHREAIATGAQ
jgi:hypothetical protein